MEVADLLPFSPKGLDSTRVCEFLTVWEGAVRSAKTICSIWAWMWDVIRSPDRYHLLLGKDQSSALGNCVESEYGLIALSAGGAAIKRDHKNRVYIDLFGKHIDVFGGDNVSSFKAFRGRSYGTVYFDEANLLHPNTIEEGFNRTIASKSRKHYMTLNPDVPGAYIYREHLDVYEKNKTPGYRWWHFTLDDNPAITEERKAEIRQQYTGIFFKRYILGLRVRAEGVCYPSFKRNAPGEPGNILDELPANIYRVTLGADIGGNKSATVFHSTGWYTIGGKVAIVTIDEFYDKENKNTETVIENWRAFVKRVREPRLIKDARGERYITLPIDRAFSDSAEQLIRKSMDGIGGVHVEDSWKAEIIDRIRCADMLYAQGRKNIMRTCVHAIEATESAIYDPKAPTGKDDRLDDGTTDIDSLDADEYSWERDMTRLIRGDA